MEGEGCRCDSLYMASLPWSAHCSLNSVLCRIWITGLYISTIQQEGLTQRCSVSLRKKEGMN